MLYIILFISITVNIIFVLPYTKYYFKKIYNWYFAKPFFKIDDKNSTIVKAILKSSVSIKKTIMIQQEYSGLFIDIKNFFKSKRNNSFFNNFYTAYLYVGLSQYALKYKDDDILNYVKKKADEWIDNENIRLNYKLSKVDQFPIGILYINLYKMTNEGKYKKVAEFIYNKLLEKSKEVNKYIIKYNDNDNYNNYVDVLGMVVPFLMEYYNLQKDVNAYKLAQYNIEQYYKCAVDKGNGIPAHGYSLTSGIKVGSCNWGRGIGWYLLANAYCKNCNINQNALEQTIKHIPYTQFPGQYSQFDSSTALMIEIFKQSRNNTSKVNIDFIKNKIRTNGMIDFCSGDTYNFNHYSKSYGESELCNGLFLILISKFGEI